MRRIFYRRWTWIFHRLNNHHQSSVQRCQSALLQSPLAHHPCNPCLTQFCDFHLALLKFCSMEVPTQQDFLKFTLISELGAFDHASSISKKKKNHHHHLFIKNHDLQKNHASISKLGAFSHASSILKKEIIFPPNINVFKSHASIYKLGAFGHASFIFKKGDHHRHLFIKK